MSKNLLSLGLLRNGKIYQTKELAIQGLTQVATNDGVAKLARYLDEVDGVEVVRTIVGFYADASEIIGAEEAQSSYTIMDIDGSAADIDEIKRSINNINAKIGNGIPNTTLTDAIIDINDRIGSGFSSDNTVADAISNLETSLTAALTVTMVDETSGSTEYAKVYSLYQGDNLVGKINIPKDMFVKAASVVRGTWNGDEFIENPDGPDIAIKIEFVNGDIIYVNAQDLVDIYTAGDGISIDSNVVSVVIDEDSENFLTVSQNGVKLSGVQAAIDAAVEAAKLIESDGISILENNKIKAVAAKFSDSGIDNPISVDENGVKLSGNLDCGFFDFSVVVPQTAAEIAAITDPATTYLVITSSDLVSALGTNKTYNTLVLDGVDDNTSFGISAKSIKINNSEFGGTKDSGNGKVNFAAPQVDINNVSVTNGSTMYNLFEGNQSNGVNKEFNASNVVVDNPSLAHNVFNIYRPDNNAKIVIKDSVFNLTVDNSNPLRLANYTNATGVTVLFEDVDWTYENSLSSEDWGWAGLIIYQPSSTDAGLTGDASYVSTWTFKFKNCRYNGVKVDSVNFGEHNQVIYAYNFNKTGLITDITELGVTVEFE